MLNKTTLTLTAATIVLMAGVLSANGLQPGDVLILTRSDATPVVGYGNTNNEDILALHPTSWTGAAISGGTWGLYFDGTTKMASTQAIDALHVFWDGSFIFSTQDPATVPYPGPGGISYDDIDLVYYDIALNTFHKFFDGSDHGMPSGMNIMACAIWGNNLILSTGVGGTLGSVVFDANDLVAWTPTTPGDWNGAGSWSLFLDGSDIGLDSAIEKIDGLHILGGDGVILDGMVSASNGGLPIVLFSVDTIGGQLNQNASNLAFDDEDIVAFVPTSLGANTAGSAYIWMDGAAVGLGNLNSETNAFSVLPIPEPMTVLLLGTGVLSLFGWSQRRRLV